MAFVGRLSASVFPVGLALCRRHAVSSASPCRLLPSDDAVRRPYSILPFPLPQILLFPLPQILLGTLCQLLFVLLSCLFLTLELFLLLSASGKEHPL